MDAGGIATIAGLDGEVQNHGLTIGFPSSEVKKSGMGGAYRLGMPNPRPQKTNPPTSNLSEIIAQFKSASSVICSSSFSSFGQHRRPACPRTPLAGVRCIASKTESLTKMDAASLSHGVNRRLKISVSKKSV
jgi:hypothetical protein